MKYLLLSLLLFVLSCSPNDDSNSDGNPTNDKFSENFGNEVNRDFIGQVVDAANYPIQNVTIKIGSSTVQTDINGVFIINNASVYQKFAFITAKKTGYLDGSRSMVPTSGKNNVKIMLIQNTPIATIQSGVTSEVSIYSGTKVVFDGAFQDENGNDYAGSVNVSIFHLTPSDENISELMPGMLYAQALNNDEAVLETFGMLNVELRGTSGQKLNIKTGHKAEISLRIDDNQLATAPATIPLWHFDETKGYWKEEGVATKVGNKYVGEVSHFSWWNCDIPQIFIQFNVRVVNNDGEPLKNVRISLTNSIESFSLNNTTDSNGQLSGHIPINQSYTLNAYNLCDESVFSQPVSSGSITVNHPDIIIENTTKIIGNLKNCNNQNVQNGYALLLYNSKYYLQSVTDGNFSFNFIKCQSINQFSLNGFDFENNKSSNYLTGNISNVAIVNLDNISTCYTNSNVESISGSYTVYVVRLDGNTQEVTYTDEIIYQIAPNYYKTTSTAQTSVAQTAAPDKGYNFSIQADGTIKVPQQLLCQGYFTNIIHGIPENNQVDGYFYNENSFVIEYELLTTSNVYPQPRYRAIYTRN